MFDRFTENAIKAIELAQKETICLGHNLVGTEMILLGLIGEGTNIAAKAFESMGIGLNDARVEVDNKLYMILGYSYPKRKKAIGKCSGIVEVEIPFTSNAKRIIEMSIEEAQKHVPRLDLSRHSYIGTEHLLISLLLPNGGGLAIDVLEELGVDPSNILQASVATIYCML
ncbi:unnamed protein product [Lactuca virosa]|uniref:Clp R domain-containing protein n=1 Tax=Lactuca virosa TaxID=75947 RepID=A0AAU9M0A8_9ASTR|nr:unnamed protein product [Lactuca virosa]